MISVYVCMTCTNCFDPMNDSIGVDVFLVFRVRSLNRQVAKDLLPEISLPCIHLKTANSIMSS